MESIIQPITIKYKGLLADSHQINSIDFGNSVIGHSALSTNIMHFISKWNIPKGKTKKEFQCVTTAPKEGSFEWVNYILPIAPAIQSLPDFGNAIEYLFNNVSDFVVNKLSGNDSIGKIADTMRKMNKDNNKAHIEALKIFKEANKENLVQFRKLSKDRDKLTERLIETLGSTGSEFADSQKKPMIDFVQPIGGSCNKVVNYIGENKIFVIGRKEAEIIRTMPSERIGKIEEFVCNQITELNLNNGHCLLSIANGPDEIIVGEIKDPEVKRPNNIYSSALDEHRGFIIKGKPVFKNGELVKIHVFDADYSY